MSSSPEGLDQQAPAAADQGLGQNLADEADKRPSEYDIANSSDKGLWKCFRWRASGFLKQR